MLGQYTDEMLRDLLRLSEREIAAQRQRGRMTRELRPQPSRLSPGCTRVNCTGLRLTLKPAPAACTRL